MTVKKAKVIRVITTGERWRCSVEKIQVIVILNRADEHEKLAVLSDMSLRMRLGRRRGGSDTTPTYRRNLKGCDT